MRAHLERTEQLAPGIMQFWFQPEGPLRFTAGQFVNVRIPHQADSRGEYRRFTLTSTPAEPSLSFVARLPRGPHSTYKAALFTLRPGDAVEIVEPLGDFVLPKVASVPMVWLAGGLGAASFVAMAKELSAEAAPRNIHFFQSARSTPELLFPAAWQLARLQPTQTVTGNDSAWTGRRARFTVHDLISPVYRHLGDTMFYISGSEQMVDHLCAELEQLNLDRAQIVREAYTGY